MNIHILARSWLGVLLCASTMRRVRPLSDKGVYHIKNYVPLLKSLKSARPKKRNQILKTADKGLFKAIGESARNCLKGNVPLNRKQFICLKKHRHQLRKIANKSTSLKTRKRLIQKGGFLNALLGPVIKAVTSLLGL